MLNSFSSIDLQLFAEDLVDEQLDIPETDVEGNDPTDPVGNSIETEENDLDEGNDSKEEFIPKSQVSRIVSDRVNKLNEKYKNFDRYKSSMEKLIKMSGMTEEQFFTQLEQVELQQQAQKMGVSPEIAQQMMASQRALEEAKRTTMDMKYQMEEQALTSNPLYNGYNEVKDDVRKMAESTGMSLEQSYWALHGATLIEKQTKLAEQRVAHNIQHKQKRSSVETDGNTKTPNTPGSLLDDNQRKMAENLGISADEYALYSREDLTYDQLMEMKKK